MSDIPYSVRDNKQSISSLRGFNFTDLNPNELTKKSDDGTSMTGSNIYINDAGAIGLAGLNFGTISQVLTSGGEGNPANWATIALPLPNTFARVELPSAYTGFTGSSGGGIIPTLVEVFPGRIYYGRWSTTNNNWDVPTNAYYKIDLSVEFSSTDTRKLEGAICQIKNTPENGDPAVVLQSAGINVGSHHIDEYFATATTLAYLKYNDKISFEVLFTTGTTAGITLGTKGTSANFQLISF